MITDNIKSMIIALSSDRDKLENQQRHLETKNTDLSGMIRILNELVDWKPDYVKKVFETILVGHLFEDVKEEKDRKHELNHIRDLLHDIEYALGHEHPYNPKYDVNVVANSPSPHHNLAYTLDLLINFVNDRT